MFCGNCGNQVSDGMKFCGNCGAVICNNDVPAAATTSCKCEKKSKKKLWIILSAAIVLTIAIALVSSAVIISNVSKNVEKELLDNVWYSDPMGWVAVDGSSRSLVAYTIEFNDDGTAIRTTYIAECDADDEPEEKDMKPEKTEKLDWKIKGMGALYLDGERYTCSEIDEGRLNLGRIYYAENQRDYGED